MVPKTQAGSELGEAHLVCVAEDALCAAPHVGVVLAASTCTGAALHPVSPLLPMFCC